MIGFRYWVLGFSQNPEPITHNRNMSFKDIKGQEQALGIIKESIAKRRFGRGYLFTGPEGIGKRMAAITLAKALNCESQNFDSCEVCPSCRKIDARRHPDVHFINCACIDKNEAVTGSIKIDDIRSLQRQANLLSYEGRMKVFIIDNAHNLTDEASGALLKILEEPPGNMLIILITSKTALLFKTIISRCQNFKFYPMPRAGLKMLLTDDFKLEPVMAHYLAYLSEGRLGAALSLKDSAVISDKNRIIDEFGFGKSHGNMNSISEDKDKLRYALNVLVVWFRDIYLLKSGNKDVVNLDRCEDLAKAAAVYSFQEIDELIKAISGSLLYIGQNINIKLILLNLKAMLKPGIYSPG